MRFSAIQRGLIVFIFALLPTALFAVGDLNRSFTVSPGGLLVVEAENGSITVDTDAGTSATVEIIPKDVDEFLRDYQYSISQEGNSIRVKIAAKSRLDSWFSWGRKGFKIVASIPREFNVDLQTSGGSISVADLVGKADAGTSGGSIDLGRMHGPVTAETSGGSIKLGGAVGEVVLKTSGGFIEVGEVEGSLEAGTSGGSISVDGAQGKTALETSGGSISAKEVRGAITAETSGGSISVGFGGPLEGDSLMETSGGGIDVSIPGNVGLQLDASSSGGSVSANLASGIQGRIEKSRIEGVLNGGGPRLKLRTSGGGISISDR